MNHCLFLVQSERFLQRHRGKSFHQFQYVEMDLWIYPEERMSGYSAC